VPYARIVGMTNALPPPLILRHPGVIRWEAQRSDGARSLTWRAEGSVNKKGEENIYFRTRQTMGDMKLSLHPDWWGYGYTGEFATARGLDPKNRHLSKFDPRGRGGSAARLTSPRPRSPE
jgi:hypothetical protein